jgi:hypothetical protein
MKAEQKDTVNAAMKIRLLPAIVLAGDQLCSVCGNGARCHEGHKGRRVGLERASTVFKGAQTVVLVGDPTKAELNRSTRQVAPHAMEFVEGQTLESLLGRSGRLEVKLGGRQGWIPRRNQCA